MRKVADFLFRLIYPPRCPSCGVVVDDYRFCEGCLSEVKILSPPWCEICGRPFDLLAKTRKVCSECAGHKQYFVKACSATLYHGPMAEAIKRLKYHKRPSLVRGLSPFLAQAITSLHISSNDVFLIPVPLHSIRLRERGFNQSELLAREVGRMLGMEVETKALYRKFHTRPQVELSGKDRRENVKGAFEVRNPERVKGRKFIVIDDVMTTGATLRECARALKRGGVSEVYAVTLARQVER